MKKILATLACLLILSISQAQKIKESEVPKAVLESFSNTFKGVKVEKWEKEDGNYEAEFDWNKKETTVTFTPEGKLLETEQEISKSALLKASTDYIETNYSEFKIIEAAKLLMADGSIRYEAEIKRGKEKIDLIFDSNGNFLMKE